MFRTSIVTAVFFLLAGVAWVQQSKTPAPAPPTQFAPPPVAQAPVQQKNPLHPTPEVMAKAKTLYGYDCASCHGDKGDGKGDLAKDMGVVPPDFTNPASLKDKPDGELFTSIKSGKGQMPAEGDRANDEQIWGLVLYCRSFSEKTVPSAAKATTKAK